MAQSGRLFRLAVAGTTSTLEVDGNGSVRVPGRSNPVQVARLDASRFQVALDGGQLLVYLVVEGAQGWAFADGCVFELDLAPDRPAPTPTTDADRPIAAPMPATVLSVLVEPGQAVRQGDALIVLEAMKMELTLRAPRGGQIETLACGAGDLVKPHIPLITLTDEPLVGSRLSDASVTRSTDLDPAESG